MGSAHHHPEYGRLVKLDHGNGLATRCTHNFRLLVKAGDIVRCDPLVSRIRTAGRSTAAHLPFEISDRRSAARQGEFRGRGDAAPARDSRDARGRAGVGAGAVAPSLLRKPLTSNANVKITGSARA